jgi:hypothetical protein
MKHLLLVLTLFSLKSFAQSEEDLVKVPITALFDGMRKTDTALLRSAFAPSAVLQTIVRNKEGKVEVRNEEVSGFVASIGKPRTVVLDERITYDLIRIDDNLAIAWTPYKFYIDDQFSHCGVNSFQLVKIQGEWKIQYLIDTRRKEKCL